MPIKTVKEVMQNASTGEVTIEYSDNTVVKYSIAQLPYAEVIDGEVKLNVLGEDIGTGSGSVSGATFPVIQDVQAGKPSFFSVSTYLQELTKTGGGIQYLSIRAIPFIGTISDTKFLSVDSSRAIRIHTMGWGSAATPSITTVTPYTLETGAQWNGIHVYGMTELTTAIYSISNRTIYASHQDNTVFNPSSFPLVGYNDITWAQNSSLRSVRIGSEVVFAADVTVNGSAYGTMLMKFPLGASVAAGPTASLFIENGLSYLHSLAYDDGKLYLACGEPEAASWDSLYLLEVATDLTSYVNHGIIAPGNGSYSFMDVTDGRAYLYADGTLYKYNIAESTLEASLSMSSVLPSGSSFVFNTDDQLSVNAANNRVIVSGYLYTGLTNKIAAYVTDADGDLTIGDMLLSPDVGSTDVIGPVISDKNNLFGTDAQLTSIGQSDTAPHAFVCFRLNNPFVTTAGLRPTVNNVTTDKLVVVPTEDAASGDTVEVYVQGELVDVGTDNLVVGNRVYVNNGVFSNTAPAIPAADFTSFGIAVTKNQFYLEKRV